jgi:hypothetical protein
VKDAVGVRLTALPMTPERVFRALASHPVPPSPTEGERAG